MKKLKKHQTKGLVQPIYTDDPNDPRLRAYNDSLTLFNASQRALKNYNVEDYGSEFPLIGDTRDVKSAYKRLNSPVPVESKSKNLPYSRTDATSLPIQVNLFKQPVQPVVYQKPPQTTPSQPKAYNKKYPPIYVTDSNDPSIGQYNAQGNQYLYQKPAPKYHNEQIPNPQIAMPNLSSGQATPANSSASIPQWDYSQPTKYAFAYPDESGKQKNMYFKNKAALQDFMKGARGTSSQEGQDYMTATGYLKKGGMKKYQIRGIVPYEDMEGLARQQEQELTQRFPQPGQSNVPPDRIREGIDKGIITGDPGWYDQMNAPQQPQAQYKRQYDPMQFNWAGAGIMGAYLGTQALLNKSNDRHYQEYKNRWIRDYSMPSLLRDPNKFSSQYYESPIYQQGGIHINPANRGKFNATKKRTGKSTEELTHSKNPVTKKRAIFAQNAAKWHHQDGGMTLNSPEDQRMGYFGYPEASSLTFPGTGERTFVPGPFPLKVKDKRGTQIMTNRPITTYGTVTEVPLYEMGGQVKKLKGVKREDATIEAEKDELIFGAGVPGAVEDQEDRVGIGLYKVGGKKHSEGGTPIKAYPGDFVFSNDKSLQFTEEEAEATTGDKVKKAKLRTPAKLANKYMDLNDYITMAQDKDVDDISKKTAALNINNYVDRLAEIAYVQEAKKGFPDEVPDFVKTSLDARFNQDELQGALDQFKFGGQVQYQRGGNYSGYEDMFNQIPGTNRPPVERRRRPDAMGIPVPPPDLSGDPRVPAWFKLWTSSNTVKGRTTPTGRNSVYDPKQGNQIYDDYSYWKGVNQGKDFSGPAEYQKFIYNQVNAQNPQSIESMWNDYGTTAAGLNNPNRTDRGFADTYFGARTAGLSGWRPTNPGVTPTNPEPTDPFHEFEGGVDVRSVPDGNPVPEPTPIPQYYSPTNNKFNMNLAEATNLLASGYVGKSRYPPAFRNYEIQNAKALVSSSGRPISEQPYLNAIQRQSLGYDQNNNPYGAAGATRGLGAFQSSLGAQNQAISSVYAQNLSREDQRNQALAQLEIQDGIDRTNQAERYDNKLEMLANNKELQTRDVLRNVSTQVNQMQRDRETKSLFNVMSDYYQIAPDNTIGMRPTYQIVNGKLVPHQRNVAEMIRSTQPSGTQYTPAIQLAQSLETMGYTREQISRILARTTDDYDKAPR